MTIPAGPLLTALFYHTISIFSYLEEENFWKNCKKKMEMLVTQIVNFKNWENWVKKGENAG